ncbi:MAG: hypothetical protein KKG59_06095 [Nanoarchaeota archaeon]|nr:hypothetical protein [Nanoarchaeota archaeon]
MFVDIVFPKDNEEEFLEVAKKLKSKLVFIGSKPEKVSGTYSGQLVVNTGGIKKGFDLNIGKAKREFIESKKVDLIFGFEDESFKDGMHQRNSGLNHVLCKLAKDKNKMIAFDFSLLLHAKDKQLVFGRMLQNAMLLKKFKNQVVIASFAKNPYELRSGKDYQALLEELGFDIPSAKTAVNRLGDFLNSKL